ncbi:MAG: carboxypeptidase regulatory-like domain-containing protein [Roseiflexaceae bacterium]|nr:carboxypeptidase regulatory-like domain-containing protein [Roseiflexaceae bacterium]
MRQLRTLLVIGGMLTCLLGIGSLMLPIHPAIAQSLPLPDRPTLTPRPIPAESKQSNPIVATSRIAGTVIDTRTGAPTAGITVQVGDTMVKTDANGNYDLNGLVAGTYTIALVLSADQGVAEQGALTISVAEDASVIQHLSFRSPAPPVESAPLPVPATLPVTGGNESSIWLFMVGVLMIISAGLVRRQV